MNFLREITFTDFSEVLRETDIHLAADKFSKIFSSVLNNHAPLKIFQNRKNYAPYLSDTIKKEMSLRNEFKQQSLHSNDPGILVEYKILRNRIRAKLRKEKSEYYSKKLADIGNNSKQL